MSEIQKPVAVEEQQPTVVETVIMPTPGVVEANPAPVVIETIVAPAAAAEAPAPAVEEAKPVTEEVKPEVAVEEKFTGEGVLGYKAPGGFLKKLAGFQKRHFWLGSEAVEVKSLSNYLRGEKPEIGNHNAAWSAQTGKGLLYFSKLAGDKIPAGVINLADVTDIKEDGTVDFLFHIHGQKHVFQATNTAVRNSWVEALKATSIEAKESVEAITGSEGYKEVHSSLTKPVEQTAPVTPKEEKKEEVVAANPIVAENPTTTEATAVTDAAEPKVATKSRSASRKRQSIFGSFNLGGKKSEEVVPKVENKDEVKAESPVEPVVAASEPAQVEPAVAVAPGTEEPAVVASTEEVRPAASKRHSSLFDFKARFGGQKKAAAPAPVVPAKDEDETVTSAEAPVIPAVEQSEPLATSIASPATVPTETTTIEPATAQTSEVKAEASAETKADRRKSSLPFGFGSKKEKTVDGEKPLSPFAKLRQTVKGKKAETAPVQTEEKVEEKTDAPVEAAPVVQDIQTEEKKVEEPVAPAPAASTTPIVAATA